MGRCRRTGAVTRCWRVPGDRACRLRVGVRGGRLGSLRHLVRRRRPGRDAVAAEVRLRLDDTGLIALDMEPIFVTPDGDHGDAVIEAAATVGARNLLVVSRGVDDDRFVERFGELCDSAAAHGIGCSLEFMAFMSIRDLPQATAVLDAVDRPNASVLIDNLHLARTGGTVADVAAVAPARLPYVQLCDAPANGARAARRRGARHPAHAGCTANCRSANSSTCSPRTPRSRSRSAPPPPFGLPRSRRPGPPRPRRPPTAFLQR